MDFETLYSEKAPRIRQFILARIRDPHAAEDIHQEVFLRVHKHLDRLRDERKVDSWIYQIARNAIADHYRRDHETLELPETLPEREDRDEMEAVHEILPSVKSFLGCLPEKYRQALVLTEYQGLTQGELAGRLGLSLSGAKSRVQRARERLKAILLNCCHFELDRFGKILDYQPKVHCCPANQC